jgi:hypothetical protein
MEEDTVPPVTLAAATPKVTPRPATAPSMTPAMKPTLTAAPDDDRVLPARQVAFTTIERPSRGHLRLVVSQTAPLEERHGQGGPAHCSCRPCVMSRHPAYGTRLSLV